MTIAGRIVEVEAYLGPEDRASHARMGPTDRNRVMFGQAGLAYVYLVYGLHHCLNIVTGPEGFPAAVLIRAVEPIEGIEAMRALRFPGGRGTGRGTPDHRLASGPGMAGAALGIDRSFTGTNLCDAASSLRLELPTPGDAVPRILATPRVGIDFAGHPWTEVPWRFIDADSGSRSRSA